MAKSNKESSATTPEQPKSSADGSKSVLFYLVVIVLWYGFSASYNVYNQLMKAFNFPFTVAVIQLVVGLTYAMPLWALNLRALPALSLSKIVTNFTPIALLNAAGHASAVMAMFEKGGGSFTHVIKASEPVVSVVLGLCINGNVPPPITTLMLLPIVYGVAYASTLGNLSVDVMMVELTTKAAVLAMASNVCFALRSIVRSKQNEEIKAAVSPENDMAISTILSIFFLTPVALYYEPYDELFVAAQAMSAAEWNKFLFDSFAGGMSFYLYNEFQNAVLTMMGPVPTAVGNTLKRVVIFVGLYLCVAGEVFPMTKVFGCGVAIAGCLGYAICKNKKI